MVRRDHDPALFCLQEAVVKPRPTPLVHLPLKPIEIAMLMTTLGEWLEDPGVEDDVREGLLSQHQFEVIQSLHQRLAKLDRALVSH
jgi:hypothetical protein